MGEPEIRAYLSLAISTLCGDRIHFCTSDKQARQHKKDAKEVQEWLNALPAPPEANHD